MNVEHLEKALKLACDELADEGWCPAVRHGWISRRCNDTSKCGMCRNVKMDGACWYAYFMEVSA